MQDLKVSKLVVHDLYPILFKLGQTYDALGRMSHAVSKGNYYENQMYLNVFSIET